MNASTLFNMKNKLIGPVYIIDFILQETDFKQ